MAITIRRTAQEDRKTIVSLIRQAKINPGNLCWKNFLVAEENGQVAGIRQIREYEPGTREVISGSVVPEYRHQCPLDERTSSW